MKGGYGIKGGYGAKGGYGIKMGGEGLGLGQARGMKVRSSVKKLCEGCKVREISSSSLDWSWD